MITFLAKFFSMQKKNKLSKIEPNFHVVEAFEENNWSYHVRSDASIMNVSLCGRSIVTSTGVRLAEWNSTSEKWCEECSNQVNLDDGSRALLKVIS